jgi:hypothetical protein
MLARERRAQRHAGENTSVPERKHEEEKETDKERESERKGGGGEPERWMEGGRTSERR